MSSRIAVIDTNVVVSGLLTSAPEATTRRILDAMLSGAVDFLLSVELLAEYRQVLLRPRIAERHGLTTEEVDVVLHALATNGIIREPEITGEEFPDPSDAHLWALARRHPGAILVTGDRALLECPASGVSVLEPSSFAATFSENDSTAAP